MKRKTLWAIVALFCVIGLAVPKILGPKKDTVAPPGVRPETGRATVKDPKDAASSQALGTANGGARGGKVAVSAAILKPQRLT
jgi:hypothetical protein